MTTIRILFICIGNTCRSPMAEAIARRIGGDDVDASSAGLMPFGRIVEGTRYALGRLGYNDAGLSSKGLEEVDFDSFDIVVSLLGQAGLSSLPATPGAHVEAWDIPDPYGEDEEIYVATARELERRIRSLLDEHTRRELPLL